MDSWSDCPDHNNPNIIWSYNLGKGSSIDWGATTQIIYFNFAKKHIYHLLVDLQWSWHEIHSPHRVIIESFVIVEAADLDGFEWILNGEREALIPLGVEVFEKCATFVQLFALDFEFDIGITCAWKEKERKLKPFILFWY